MIDKMKQYKRISQWQKDNILRLSVVFNKKDSKRVLQYLEENDTSANGFIVSAVRYYLDHQQESV